MQMKIYLILVFSSLIFACSNSTDNSLNKTGVNTINEKKVFEGERIDGPANIRDTVNGEVMFELIDTFHPKKPKESIKSY